MDEMKKVHDWLAANAELATKIIEAATAAVDADYACILPKPLRDSVVAYWEHSNKGIV